MCHIKSSRDQQRGEQSFRSFCSGSVKELIRCWLSCLSTAFFSGARWAVQEKLLQHRSAELP